MLFIENTKDLFHLIAGETNIAEGVGRAGNAANTEGMNVVKAGQIETEIGDAPETAGRAKERKIAEKVERERNANTGRKAETVKKS